MPAASLGVLGGSFDPVHNGHLALARAGLRHLRLDTLLLIPAGNPPHKSATIKAPANHRLAMLRAAVAGMDGVEVWDGELRRAGPSYTVDTLRELGNTHPGAEIRYIIGSDNLDEIKTWHRYAEILSSVALCVTHRPGHAMAVPPELAAARVIPFPSPEADVSSSAIREAIARGRPWRQWVPAAVAGYIADHGLYTPEGPDA